MTTPTYSGQQIVIIWTRKRRRTCEITLQNTRILETKDKSEEERKYTFTYIVQREPGQGQVGRGDLLRLQGVPGEIEIDEQGQGRAYIRVRLDLIMDNNNMAWPTSARMPGRD